MDCRARLETYLQNNGVQFIEQSHRAAYTAQRVAQAQDVPGKLLAKVTVVNARGKLIMLVLPASGRVDFMKLRAVLDTVEVRLAAESEFEQRFPDCDAGAMPPFGNLYNMPVYVDRTLTEDEEIVFQAGTHRHTMTIAYKDYERLARPTVADFAEHAPATPELTPA